MPTPDFNFLIYKTAEEDITVNAVIRDETIWLTQKAMAELFGVQAPAISKHLNNIYEEGELLASSTISKMEIVQEEGSRAVKRLVDFYNLDAIISVGYRINSRRATQFRIWATGVLKEYMVKGFAMDDDRLKQGKTAFGKDYFRELLERVRSIRASERRIWQQVTDIYAECSIDYDRNAPTTQQFYAMVQNRFHYAITHKTAAEIVHDSADHTKEHIGQCDSKNALPHYMPGFKVFDFALPAALQDKASVSIRLRCASLTGTDGKSSVVPNATNRLGHVSIKYNK